MKVNELMAKEVRACSPDETLNRAAQLMWENDCGAIPVVDADAKLVGMLTDRDICMAAYTQGVLLNDARIAGAMSRDVITCAPSDTVATAQQKMREHQIRRLPVIGADGRLIGIVSLTDIAREADRERAAKLKKRAIKDAEIVETLGAISISNSHSRASDAA